METGLIESSESVPWCLLGVWKTNMMGRIYPIEHQEEVLSTGG